MKNTCRTCLVRTNLIPIFDSKGTILHSIQLASGLTVTENDGLPQVICMNCFNTIESIIEFRERCNFSLRQLLKLKKNQGKSLSQQLQILKSPEIDSSLYEVNSNTCADKTENDDLETIDDDYEIKINQEEKNFESIRRTHNALEQKILLSSANKNNEKYLETLKKCKQFSDGPIESDGPVRCKICKRKSKNISSFYLHLRIHIGFNHMCEFCGKKFYASVALKRHCMSFHGIEKELACSYCDYKTVSITRLKEHERIHIGVRPFTCDECGSKFHTRSSIIQHLRLHVNEKTVQCDRCPSMFKSRRALSTHISQTHVRDYVYLCYICDKRYTKNVTVRQHLTKQHGVSREQQGAIPRFSLSRCAIVNMA